MPTSLDREAGGAVYSAMRWLLVLMIASTASTAYAERRPTFMATTTYQSCHKETMLACGMIDAAGNRYGTAHELERCESYVFQPDGTFTTHGMMLEPEGTYRIFAGKVTLVFDNQPDLPVRSVKARTLVVDLSPDGSLLGDMKRLVTKPARAPE
jgi:hypothetical protein